MAKILIVDDEKSIQEFFDILLTKEGWSPVCVGSAEAAVEQLKKQIFDLVISDVSMPGMSGMDLLTQLRQLSPETPMVLITAFGTTESAVEAMKQGATDYLLKPFKVEEIKIVIRQILERAAIKRENILLKRELSVRLDSKKMLGNSRVMSEIFTMIKRLAANRSNVLITGSSGTGKELVARAIHDQSERKNAPFVSVNCGAIPENLIESELFGHLRGAFTGAVANKRGLMEAAEQGTFFLDEVGELPQQTQVKLLRVLQERKIRRIGSTEDTSIECRIIAATNRDLEKEVATGRFREDLYYRLNVFGIRMPNLKERAEDIPQLLAYFTEKYSLEHHKQNISYTPEALKCFQEYPYPGNVRELENLVEQTVALSEGGVVDRSNLPIVLREAKQGNSIETLAVQTADSNPARNFTECDLDNELSTLERRLISAALQKSGGVKQKAAKLLHISFRSMRYRLIKLGLEKADVEVEEDKNKDK